MKIRPLQDRLIVKRVAEENKTKGGIIIPDSAKEKPLEGKVVAVGNGKILEDGKVRALDIKAGDTIAINGALRHNTFTAPDGKEHRRSSIDGRQFQVLDRAPEKAIEPRIRRHGKVLDRGM